MIHQQTEKRIDELLGRMTLDEKVGQLSQDFMLNEGKKDAIRQGRMGSSIFASSAWAGKDVPASVQAEFANEYQRVAVEQTRLGIPLLFGRDVIHGHRTVFPIPLGQAASWDPELVEQAASTAAREATADGVKWFFSPMLDIARDPRWGRIAEGFGEDPCLGSAMASAVVRGFQGDDLANPEKAIACPKHYVGYGGAQGGRDYDAVDLSMRTLRDVYLPPFHAAVEAGAATLMSAFHDFCGVPVSANRLLLTDILRGEWGFDGFVVSDWAAVQELVQHGVAADNREAASKALLAGVDMDMVSGVYLSHLAGLVQQGNLDPAVVDQAVRRILRVKMLAGLFENPYTDPARAARVMLAPQHRLTARRLAQESIVLLKNEGGILPLGTNFRRIAVVGPLAHAREELFGSWTLDGRREDVTSIADALRAAAPKDVTLTVTSGYADVDVNLASRADAVIVVVGEHPSRSGEASSLSTLDLPAGQRQLVEAILEGGTPVILVVIAGRPLALTHEVRGAQAVLYAWQPGVEGGSAVADLIFGTAVPSGKLPVTLPRTVGQVPIYYSHKNTGRPPRRDSYTTGYIDMPIEPLFPFGYGLSYTTFAYSNLKVAQSVGGSVEVSAEVTNTGKVAGTEVVQLYIRDLVGSVTRPVRELKGFRRVPLQPGGSAQVHFTLRPEDLMFTGMDERSIFEPGDFQVWVAPDSASGLQGAFKM